MEMRFDSSNKRSGIQWSCAHNEFVFKWCITRTFPPRARGKIVHVLFVLPQLTGRGAALASPWHFFSPLCPSLPSLSSFGAFHPRAGIRSVINRTARMTFYLISSLYLAPTNVGKREPTVIIKIFRFDSSRSEPCVEMGTYCTGVQRLNGGDFVSLVFSDREQKVTRRFAPE